MGHFALIQMTLFRMFKKIMCGGCVEFVQI